MRAAAYALPNNGRVADDEHTAARLSHALGPSKRPAPPHPFHLAKRRLVAPGNTQQAHGSTSTSTSTSTSITHPDGNAEPSNPRVLGTENTRANNASDTSPESMFVESVRRVALASNRAPEQHGQQAEACERINSSGQAISSSLAVTTHQPSPHPPQGLRTQNGSPSLIHGQNLLAKHANSQTPSLQILQGTYNQSPHSLSRLVTQHPYSIPAGPTRSAAPEFERTVQQPTASGLDWYTVQQCLHVFYGFRVSSTASSKFPRDLKRMEVLRRATVKQDWSYLTMHQYYCLSSYMPTAIPTRLRHQPNTNQAQQVIRSVLDTNDCLSPDVLKFFSNYPFPMQQIASTWPQKFEREACLLHHFSKCSPGYIQLASICEKRKCPPIMQELVEIGISSPTFQRLLFTALFRRVWQAVPPQPQLQNQFEDLAVGIFVQNQTEVLQHQTLVERNIVLNIQTPELNKEMELHRWGSKLKQLADTFNMAFRAQGSSLTGLLERQQSQLYALQRQQQCLQQQQQQSVPPNHPPLPTRPGGMRIHSGLADARTASVAIQQTHERHPPHQPPSQTLAQRQTQPTSMPLLPPSGWIQPQQRQPNPVRFSLHQANLRSPVLQAQNIDSQLYHYVYAFAIRPTRLSNAGQAVERWTFTLSQSEMQCIPKCVPSTLSTPETQAIIETENTKTIRLRCIKWPSNDNPNMHAWAIGDTCWIPYSYFKFNGTSLEQRKKVHHGKDLPIDLTGLLREGENALETTVVAMSNNTSYLQYLIAIEVLGFTAHNCIKQRCLDNIMSADDTISVIKKKLRSSSEDDTDDFSIVESNLTINILDPFSASRICDIPVRSKACLHIDCFDLETFLQTRQRKGDASVTDQWRCPICNADARPSELVVDGFLVEVKKELENQGLAHTRAIIVDQDGTWRPKKEARDPNGVQDQETPEVMGIAAVGKPAVQRSVEVIDLSD